MACSLADVAADAASVAEASVAVVTLAESTLVADATVVDLLLQQLSVAVAVATSQT